jgi:hypothetical protein
MLFLAMSDVPITTLGLEVRAMRKLWLWLPAGLTLGMLLLRPAFGQMPGDEFGKLRTGKAPIFDTPPSTPVAPTTPPAGKTAPGGAGLPMGVEPVATDPARPVNPFPITAAAGAWVICAAHFPGTDGFDWAVQTVNELRSKYRYQAFILDRGAELRRQQDEEWEEYKKRMHGAPLRRRMVRIEDEYAVLIGGFKDFESATAALTKVRALPMPKLKSKPGTTPYQTVVYTVPAEEKVKAIDVNPYSQAMVVRNPMAGTAANKPKVDPFLKTLNDGEEYSLLKNKKKYTLMIKEYHGATVVESQVGGKSSGGGFMGLFNLAKNSETSLSAGAAQAHELAKFLRSDKIGMDAWVLHTRRSSIVTVGSFEKPDDPAILKTARKLSGLKFTPQGGGHDPVGLMSAPLVVEIPRP